MTDKTIARIRKFTEDRDWDLIPEIADDKFICI